jgi:4a-hydroxytetrahydrobiopterin dehydratase
VSPLATERCAACRPGTPPVTGEELERLQGELDPAWTVEEGKRLRRRMGFPDFVRAAGRAVEVALLAQAEDHHPDLRVGWGYLEIELITHSIGGLSRNDFILAAKIDMLASPA